MKNNNRFFTNTPKGGIVYFTTHNLDSEQEEIVRGIEDDGIRHDILYAFDKFKKDVQWKRLGVLSRRIIIDNFAKNTIANS